MRFQKYIIILPLLCWAANVSAQETEAVQVPEQWQMSLEVIKSKAQSLMVENNGLQAEHQQLMQQVQGLQRSIDDQQQKNEQMNRLIKERHGQTDQQVRIEELKQAIKIKKQNARAVDERLEILKEKQSGLDRKIQLLNARISDIQSHPPTIKEKVQILQNSEPPSADGQLDQLRQQLEDGNKQEVLLEDELNALKNGGKGQDFNLGDIEAQNKELEARLDTLRSQRLQHEKKSSDAELAQANERMYDELKKRKDQLEANIASYEARLDDLRGSSLIALSWRLKKKKLIHEMVQTDAHNNQMRDKIKVLREDIDVLRDQVAKFERRVDFVQDKGVKQ